VAIDHLCNTRRRGGRTAVIQGTCAAVHELSSPESHLQSSLMMTATIPNSAWASFLSGANPPTCAFTRHVNLRITRHVPTISVRLSTRRVI
jgi:hypothetical protein